MVTLGDLISGDLGYSIVLLLDPTTIINLMLAEKRIYKSWWVPKFLEIVKNNVVIYDTPTEIDIPQWVTHLSFRHLCFTGPEDSEDGDFDDDSDDFETESKLAPNIPNCPNVVKLHYHDTKVHCLGIFPKVKALSAYYCFGRIVTTIPLYNLVKISLERTGPGLVSFFKNTPNLKILEYRIQDDFDHWGPEECQTIKQLEKLEELTVRPISVDSFSFLDNKKRLCLLKIDFVCNYYSQRFELPKDIEYFSTLESLKVLELNCFEKFEDDLAIVEKIKTLVPNLSK